MAIEWRSVPGWEGLYEVSSAGAVRSLARVVTRPNGVRVPIRPRVMKPYVCNGYNRVTLTDGAIKQKRYIHDLVCRAWHGPPPHSHEVAHGNNNRLDNVPSNLRWATKLGNMRDKELHGTQPKGEQIWLTKLTESQALDALLSKESNRALADRFGVALATVWAIRTGKSWKHLRRAA